MFPPHPQRSSKTISRVQSHPLLPKQPLSPPQQSRISIMNIMLHPPLSFPPHPQLHPPQFVAAKSLIFVPPLNLITVNNMWHGLTSCINFFKIMNS